jgi:carboxymethylenebutenolidase
LAKAGYLALAPDLFVRQGDASREQSIADLMANIVRKTPDSDVMGDLDAVVEWAHTNGGDTGRLGITGFCYGGRITWLYSHHNPQVKAGVAWYGRLVGERTAAWPALPVDIAPALKVPVLGLYGGKDRGITLDSVSRCAPPWRKEAANQPFTSIPMPARLQRRLPPGIPSARGTEWLAACAGLVPGPWRGLS